MNIKKVVVASLIGISTVFFHELAHKRIFEIYKCEDITYHFIYINAMCDLDTSIQLATSIAEIIGYTSIPIIILLILIYMRCFKDATKD